MADAQNFDRQLFLQSGQPGIGDAELGGRGETMANAERFDLRDQSGRCSRQSRPDSSRSGNALETMANAGGLQLSGRSEHAKPGEELADIESLRREKERPEQPRFVGLSAPEFDRDPMADTECRGLRAKRQCEALAYASSNGLPRFPPGLDALSEWERILAIDPSLEPALCRMADGLAHRVDRLRLTGNGVVPDTAALAYLTLDRELSS